MVSSCALPARDWWRGLCNAPPVFGRGRTCPQACTSLCVTGKGAAHKEHPACFVESARTTGSCKRGASFVSSGKGCATIVHLCTSSGPKCGISTFALVGTSVLVIVHEVRWKCCQLGVSENISCDRTGRVPVLYLTIESHPTWDFNAEASCPRFANMLAKSTCWALSVFVPPRIEGRSG
jgi:hypothetical protein